MMGRSSYHERPGARIMTMNYMRRIPFPKLDRAVAVVAHCGKNRAGPLVTGRHARYRRNHRVSRSK